MDLFVSQNCDVTIKTGLSSHRDQTEESTELWRLRTKNNVDLVRWKDRGGHDLTEQKKWAEQNK